MKTKIKRFLSLLIAFVMVASMVPSVLAAPATSYADFPTGWSKAAMEAAVNNGLLSGYEDNLIRPQGKLTRAEFAAIMARAFGAKTTTDISGYTDVDPGAWYYDYIAKVVKMRALNGVSGSLMAPNAAITRQEVFTAVARILVLASKDTSSLDKFADKGAIASWAKEGMAGLVQYGFVNGDPQGNVNPTAHITREEFAQLMYNAIRVYITEPGVYETDMDGIVVIRAGGVTLKNMTVKGDLVIADGVMDELVVFDGVTIDGRFVARGGTITFKDSKVAGGVVVNDVNGNTHFNNYRNDPIFDGIITNSSATFLPVGGNPVRPRPVPPTPDEEATYTLVFESEDPSLPFTWADGYTAPTEFTASALVALPLAEKVVPMAGYRFVTWTYDGDAIDSLADIVSDLPSTDATITIKARFVAYYGLSFTSENPGLSFSWATGYTAPTEFTAASLATLPQADKVIPQTNYSFVTWVYDGDAIDSLEDITNLPAPGSTLEIKARFEFIGTTVYTYTLTFESENPSLPFTWAAGYIAPTGFTSSNFVALPQTDNVVPVNGYRFVTWTYDGQAIDTLSDISNLPESNSNIVIKARFAAISYGLNFVSADPTVNFTWAPGYSAPSGFSLADLKELPGVDDIIPDAGYEFAGWTYDGVSIDSLDDIANLPTSTAFLDIKANFTVKTYTVTYHASFVSGYSYDTEYTVLAPIALADVTKVIAPTGQYCSYWVDGLGNEVRDLVINHDTPANLDLYPFFDIIPPSPVTVTFYRAYTTDDYFSMGSVQITEGETVPEASFPSLAGLEKLGYKENADIASVYAGNEYQHKIAPSFWYVDASGKFAPFTDEVVVDTDMNVYVLSQALSMYMTFESNNETLSVHAYYNDETRALNTLKDLAVSGRNQLNLAIQLDMIPKYDELTDKVIAGLVRTGLIDEDKNVKVTKLSLPASTFLTESIINGVVKRFINEIVSDPDELYRVLQMIDIQDFVEQLDIDEIISDMTDAEILSILQDSSYEDDIVDFILTDVRSEEPTMLTFIIDYILGNADFKAGLLNDLIADLKDAEADSTLKTKALNYIYTELNDEESPFRTKFINMIITDLRSTSSVVMPEVVSYIKEILVADTTDGAELRKAVLTSNQLSNILNDSMVKTEVIKLVLTDAFIEQALSDLAFRHELITSVIDDEDFIDALLLSAEFHDYIIEELHGTHDIAVDIKTLIADDTSEFRDYILDVVKHDAAFLGLLTTHPELYDLLLDELTWSDFVADDDDLLKYILNQGATNTYSFVDLNEVEDAIRDRYDDEVGAIGSYDALSDTEKQDFKTELYGDSGARSELLSELQAQFTSYKTDVVDTVVAGNADSITDETVHTIIDEFLVDYVTKFINNETLNSDPTINNSIVTAIENILFGFISDLITHDNADLEGSAIQTELATMLSHIEVMKTAFIDDTDPNTIARLKTIVKTYRDDHRTEFESIIVNNYTDLVDKTLPLVNPDHANSVYGQVETLLIEALNKGLVQDSLISGYVLGISDSDLTALITTYSERLTVSDINSYLAKFLTVPDNETTLRTEMETFLGAQEQRATIESFAVTYLKDPNNDDEIISEIKTFLQEVTVDFIHNNRAVIENALTGVDISAFLDVDAIADYVDGLDADGKQAFADKVFQTLTGDDSYTKFVHSLLNDKSFKVNKDNLPLITAIATALRGFTYDSIMSQVSNATLDKILNLIGEDFFRSYFNTMKDNYCDGLDAVIAEVSASADPAIEKSYTTVLVIKVDLINDVYRRLYDKAEPKVVAKLQAIDKLAYDENEYLQFLVTDDILGRLLTGGPEFKTEELTGYQLKDVLSYYDYMLMLMIVGDDALGFYGDRVDEEQIEGLYEAMFGKAKRAHAKINEILEEYADDNTLPAQVQTLVDRVQKVNDLLSQYDSKIEAAIRKYLNSSINIKLENTPVVGEDKVVSLVELLLGTDDPVVNVDTLYALMYSLTDKAQAKLQSVLASGKLDAAIAKFEATSIGDLLNGKGQLGTVGDKLDEFKNNGKITSAIDNVRDLLEILAQEGLEPFRTDESGIMVKDAYEVRIAQVTLKIKRYYR